MWSVIARTPRAPSTRRSRTAARWTRLRGGRRSLVTPSLVGEVLAHVLRVQTDRLANANAIDGAAVDELPSHRSRHVQPLGQVMQVDQGLGRAIAVDLHRRSLHTSVAIARTAKKTAPKYRSQSSS